MQHKVPLARLLQANPYVDVYNLQVGETICVPVKSEKPREEPVYDGTQEDAGGEEIISEYTTRKGDTLESVLGVESIPLMSGITFRFPTVIAPDEK
jgi:hypothetical protein